MISPLLFGPGDFGKLPNLLEPQFPHLGNGNSSTRLTGGGENEGPSIRMGAQQCVGNPHLSILEGVDCPQGGSGGERCRPCSGHTDLPSPQPSRLCPITAYGYSLRVQT